MLKSSCGEILNYLTILKMVCKELLRISLNKGT